MFRFNADKRWHANHLRIHTHAIGVRDLFFLLLASKRVTEGLIRWRGFRSKSLSKFICPCCANVLLLTWLTVVILISVILRTGWTLLGEKNCSSCNLLQVFQVQIFLNLIVYPQSCQVQKQAWSAVVLQMRYRKNPDWDKTKTARENQVPANCSGIIVLRTPQRSIINATKLSIRKNKDEFVLPLSLGNPQPGI
jgi:hypothetical protein